MDMPDRNISSLKKSLNCLLAIDLTGFKKLLDLFKNQKSLIIATAIPMIPVKNAITQTITSLNPFSILISKSLISFLVA
jgi:hypothetical protein